jgi:hypothetical protein
MDPQHCSIMAHKFQAVLDEQVLNERGKARGLVKRQRLITPFRLGLSVIGSMATQHVHTIADLHRQFNELWDLDTAYNALYKPRLNSGAPEFFLASLSDIMSQLPMKVLGCEAGAAFSDFNRLLRQDGSSFALHQALAARFPGRFRAVSPAAVALHCTMDVLQDAPLILAWSPATDSEHDDRPEPESLRGDVWWADRGYLDVTSLRDIERSGGFLLVRGKAGLTPRVIDAYREDGQRIKACQECDVKAIVSQWPKRQRAELDVEGLLEGEPFRVRLTVRWNPETKSVDSLLTHLPQDRDTISIICLGYKLRWQVELLWKEWKSYTHLHKFDTEKDHIAESVIWASRAASAMKRFLAHAAERLLEVVISTRKASMPSAYQLPQRFRVLRDGDGPWYRRACEAMITYLGKNAKRAHPKRDARTGRSRLGLKPLFQIAAQKGGKDNCEQPAAA